MTEISSVELNEELNGAISSFDISREKNVLFRTLRVWKADEQSSVIVEGRYVQNDEQQFAASEFIIFVLPQNVMSQE